MWTSDSDLITSTPPPPLPESEFIIENLGILRGLQTSNDPPPPPPKTSCGELCGDFGRIPERYCLVHSVRQMRQAF